MNQSPPKGSKGMAMFATAPRPPALARNGSAPGSLLTGIADSVGGGRGEFQMGRLFSLGSPCLTSESTCKAGAATSSPNPPPYRNNDGGGVGSGLPRSYGVGEISVGDLPPAPAAVEGNSRGGGNPLTRHSSSPAGFLSHLMVDNVTGDTGSYSQQGTDGVYAMGSRGLSSQLSFFRQRTLSQISEISIPDTGESVSGSNNSNETSRNVGQSYISSNFSIGSWDDMNSIMFSAPPNKQAKNHDGDVITRHSSIESQFSLPTTSLEFLQIQQDQVPFKARAKRGCATHPRSIAERERRTRISDRLKKLQELVPNMDEVQTNFSTSDPCQMESERILLSCHYYHTRSMESCLWHLHPIIIIIIIVI
ncbi:transcription factor bHLH128 isoform X2 [Elaeis guineensis]|uniref:Transcription factor bHLH128 isoform X2 n=1 Tax=Elaeis guineensis var. tenera TaxID=51953 RepID=A0A6J0PE62_ELAGV|nr:transcription factor bHLH128 isoform X2 [Elaeis guineensis]